MTTPTNYDSVLRANHALNLLVPAAVVEVSHVFGKPNPLNEDTDILAWFAVNGRDDVPEWLSDWRSHGPLAFRAYEMVLALSTAHNILTGCLPDHDRPLTPAELTAFATLRRMLESARSDLMLLNGHRRFPLP